MPYPQVGARQRQSALLLIAKARAKLRKFTPPRQKARGVFCFCATRMHHPSPRVKFPRGEIKARVKFPRAIGVMQCKKTHNLAFKLSAICKCADCAKMQKSSKFAECGLTRNAKKPPQGAASHLPRRSRKVCIRARGFPRGALDFCAHCAGFVELFRRNVADVRRPDAAHDAF